MIPIDRKRVARPLELNPEHFRDELNSAADFFHLNLLERGQRVFHWRTSIWKQAKPALNELFRGKCAFCESTLTEFGDVEHFRPQAYALNFDGQSSPDHYWWLSFWWENLYLSCAACNQTKGSRFPVLGERLELPEDPHSPIEKIETECALLLDPCRDNPFEHLMFFEDGRVASVPSVQLTLEEQERYGSTNRGEVTIDTFGLNRPKLVAARSESASSLIALLKSALFDDGTVHPESCRRIREVFAPGASYLALKAQLYAPWYRKNEAHLPEDLGLDTLLANASIDPAKFSSTLRTRDAPNAQFTSRVRAAARLSQENREKKVERSSVEVDQDAETYFARANFVSRVEVNGVVGMHEFSFDFTTDSAVGSEGVPWLMLLGENGVGKTSLLKAIALTLIGEDRFERLNESKLIGNVLGMFRRGGRVRVFLTSQTIPLEVRRRNDQLIYSGAARGAKVILRGFGPSRWFPLPDSPPVEFDDFVRVRNLFNPFVPLSPADAFLRDLGGPQWRDVATGLKLLLMLGEDGKIRRLKSSLRFEQSGAKSMALGALSSGHEAVVAMAADLAQLLFKRWKSLRVAEGIVLLDEIGAHLHPRWKMRIVDGLRNMFPRVQFIVTSHEPLCLRGLQSGEIIVMRRQDGGRGQEVIPIRPTQPISKLRVDQILTSRIFGLHSTLDPDYESQMERYYDLLSRHEDKRTLTETQELEQLRATVGRTGILGSTRRDQLIYQAIDEFVVQEPTLPAQGREEKTRWTLDRVQQFWSDYEKIGEGKE
ncbi:MAG: AAA family ATPase [Chromatiaceae bacterium]|nr:AAA family ATPase [Gammaproteobacteria bacterium]MCP5407933.1 AAA family ATPase [Chromatiaceae bacterium]